MFNFLLIFVTNIVSLQAASTNEENKK